jgi:hypothetical protein
MAQIHTVIGLQVSNYLHQLVDAEHVLFDFLLFQSETPHVDPAFENVFGLGRLLRYLDDFLFVLVPSLENIEVFCYFFYLNHFWIAKKLCVELWED